MDPFEKCICDPQEHLGWSVCGFPCPVHNQRVVEIWGDRAKGIAQLQNLLETVKLLGTTRPTGGLCFCYDPSLSEMVHTDKCEETQKVLKQVEKFLGE